MIYSYLITDTRKLNLLIIHTKDKLKIGQMLSLTLLNKTKKNKADKQIQSKRLLNGKRKMKKQKLKQLKTINHKIKMLINNKKNKQQTQM